MKIAIPKEYRNRFKDKVYVSRCGNGRILLMNDKEHKSFIKSLDGLKIEPLNGLSRFIKLGIIALDYKHDNEIDIPESLMSELSKKPYKIKVELAGLVIFN